MTGREGVEAKGRRYLAEGRLTIERIDRDRVSASCRGGGTVYALGWTAATGWHCSCPARGRCAHRVALELVTVRGIDAAPAA
ncbi:MAG: hypothetical protein ABSB24_02790 [Gaiellaceae bacterium]